MADWSFSTNGASPGNCQDITDWMQPYLRAVKAWHRSDLVDCTISVVTDTHVSTPYQTSITSPIHRASGSADIIITICADDYDYEADDGRQAMLLKALRPVVVVLTPDGRPALDRAGRPLLRMDRDAASPDISDPSNA